MPTYEYEHLDEPCSKGTIFEIKQSINDPPLVECPRCRGMVKRILSKIYTSSKKSDAELRDLGFTKLVKRDDGVYENVTRRDGDSRYMIRNRPETIPNFKKTIRD